MTDTRTVTGVSLDDAVEALRVAAALGLDIPAPEGTIVYTVSLSYVENEGNRRLNLNGVYPSEDDARNALISWIIEDWKEILYMPWESRAAWRRDLETFTNNFCTWIDTHTSEDILACWGAVHGGTYTIKKNIIASHRSPCVKDTQS